MHLGFFSAVPNVQRTVIFVYNCTSSTKNKKRGVPVRLPAMHVIIKLQFLYGINKRDITCSLSFKEAVNWIRDALTFSVLIQIPGLWVPVFN